MTETKYRIITGSPINVKDFGATGDGTTDDTAAIQDAINTGATDGREIYIPEGHYKFTKLYFHYDVTNNPGFPQTDGLEGKLSIRGAGAVARWNIAHSAESRTVLESTDSTGPALELDGSDVGYRTNWFSLEDLTVVCTNTTQIFKMYFTNHMTALNRVSLIQEGTGSGVLNESPWVNSWRDVYIQGAGNDTSDTGLVIRTLAADVGGGNIILTNVNTKDFDKGWEIGHSTYGSGAIITTIDCYGCQASTSSTYGVLIGSGAKNVNWHGSYVENVNDGSNTGVGMVVRNGAQATNIEGSWFSGNDTHLQLGMAADQDTNGLHVITNIKNCKFANILVAGIKSYGGYYNHGKTIEGCYFTEDASPPGSTIGIDLEDTTQRGLKVSGNYFSSLDTNISNSEKINVYEILSETEGRLSLIKSGDFTTFTDEDATPSVGGGRNFKTNTTLVTITDFDDGIEGQEILVLSKGAITFDVTSTNLVGGSSDIVTANGDITIWVRVDSKWYLKSYSDNS